MFLMRHKIYGNFIVAKNIMEEGGWYLSSAGFNYGNTRGPQLIT
ncbi:hypothetical protein LDG_6908 [Legionella drancourtii LLAP12]|uniref:Uncharacterized protein n=1 Tax=Legionella drancourtii LLAP12 TaxID=658187 RepID=G9ENT1_9GAMM|nr:hypothetical protein LDG_6908 [Legionella drancourtii LLAP12]